MKMVPARLYLWLKGMCVSFAQTLMPSKFGRTDGFPTLLPSWVFEAIQDAAAHNPELAPERFVPYIKMTRTPEGISEVGQAYIRLWLRLDQAAKHVFVFGDDDGPVCEATLASAATLAAAARNVIVIWTGTSGALSCQQLPKACVLDLATVSGIVPSAQQAIILGRALIEIQPKTICVASSTTGWLMLRNIAGALLERSLLYAELPMPPAACGPLYVPTSAERFLVRGLPEAMSFMAPSAEVAIHWKNYIGIDAKVNGAANKELPVQDESLTTKGRRGQ